MHKEPKLNHALAPERAPNVGGIILGNLKIKAEVLQVEDELEDATEASKTTDKDATAKKYK